MSGRLVLYGDEKDPWIALDYYQVFEEGRGRIDLLGKKLQQQAICQVYTVSNGEPSFHR